MTIGGWIIMLLSVGGVTFFFGWSLYMVFTKNEASEHIHSTLDETPDIGKD